jgi:hypothetical protein
MGDPKAIQRKLGVNTSDFKHVVLKTRLHSGVPNGVEELPWILRVVTPRALKYSVPKPIQMASACKHNVEREAATTIYLTELLPHPGPDSLEQETADASLTSSKHAEHTVICELVVSNTFLALKLVATGMRRSASCPGTCMTATSEPNAGVATFGKLSANNHRSMAEKMAANAARREMFMHINYSAAEREMFKRTEATKNAMRRARMRSSHSDAERQMLKQINTMKLAKRRAQMRSNRSKEVSMHDMEAFATQASKAGVQTIIGLPSKPNLTILQIVIKWFGQLVCPHRKC